MQETGVRFPVAEPLALGFTVRMMQYGDDSFVELLRASGLVAPSGTFGGHRYVPNTSVVFKDVEGLPSGERLYWQHWLIPHVFYGTARSEMPHGWVARCKEFDHHSLGGSTTAKWLLTVWYPPRAVPHAPISAPDQPWIPLHARVDKILRSVHCPAPVLSPVRTPAVVLSSDGNAVEGSGLFPHDSVTQVVCVQNDGSPTRYGRQTLSWMELGGLWDVPIRLLDQIDSGEEGFATLRGLLVTPPAKFLECGTDQLLTGSFRGGLPAPVW